MVYHIQLHVVVSHLFRGFLEHKIISTPAKRIPFGLILIKCKLYSTLFLFFFQWQCDKRMENFENYWVETIAFAYPLYSTPFYSYRHQRKCFMNLFEYNWQTNCLSSYFPINFIAVFFHHREHLNIDKSNINTKFRFFCSSDAMQLMSTIAVKIHGSHLFPLSLSHTLVSMRMQIFTVDEYA